MSRNPNDADEHPQLVSDPDAPRSDESTAARPLHVQPVLLLAVAVGALPGTALRWWVESALPTSAGGVLWATAGVNLVGAFVLGVLLEALARRGADAGGRRLVRLCAGTGFCGALTTYSTLALEVVRTAGEGVVAVAVGYGLASVVLGVVAAAAGVWVAARRAGGGRS